MRYLISSVFSLSLISIAQATELSVEEQCIALGYNTKISICKNAGSAALLCPLNNGSSDMAVCITDSCRGYPLYKKSGKFYYQDQAGNEVEAVPSKGQLTDHMEGAFETCVSGYGDNAVTYYRVPKCKGEALYNNYFCDVGCDTEKKYPYTYHPGNTAGIVQKCVTADQTYYGYSSCNKGWVGGWSGPDGIGRCGLDDCSMDAYPYFQNPESFEERGMVESCKIGGATYYRYTECKNTPVFEKKGSVCVKKCEITCNNVGIEESYELEGDNNTKTRISYIDWGCRITTSKCRIGDIAVLDNIEIGIIVELDEAGHALLMPKSLTTPVSQVNSPWNQTKTDLPQIKNTDRDTSGKFLTKGIISYQKSSSNSSDVCYPAVRVNQYSFTTGCPHGMCKAGEWFLPNARETKQIGYNRYILANVVEKIGDATFYSAYGTVWSANETGGNSVYSIILSRPDDAVDGNKTGYWRNFIPMLSF